MIGLRILHNVLFLDGTSARLTVHTYFGACFIGDPTAYVYRGTTLVWVKPGESCSWIETLVK